MLGRWLVVVGTLMGIAAVAWFGLPEAQKKITTGDQVLPFSLPNLQGELKALPENGVLVLNFWATWCPPCRQEMPSMVKMYEKYKSKGVAVVAVSVDRDGKALADFVKEYKVPFTVLHDQDSAVSMRYGVNRYPETFLVDKHGKIQAHLMGAVNWMEPAIQQGIDRLLQGQDLAQK